ncbi:MAG: Lrp/AsnC family transcriptional regulator [Candidatus Undinarchaeales archaeon]
MKIDKKDKAILNELQKNCKLSSRQLSDKLGIPATTIHNRIKKLEENEVIKSYNAKIDPTKIGYNSSALVFIRAKQDFVAQEEGNSQKAPKPLENLIKMPQVLDAYATTGHDDIVIRVVGKDDREVGSFVINDLWKLPGIERTRTEIIVFEGESNNYLKL